MRSFFLNASTTKDCIVQILSEEWPLSTKQIFERVKKRLDSPITYQAVHKTVCSLVEEGVLSSDKKKFELSKDWIGYLKFFADSLDKAYSGKIIGSKTDLKESGVVEFNDLGSFSMAMARFFTPKTMQNSQVPLVGIVRHAWWPVPFNFMDFYALKQMAAKNKEVYEIILERAPLDKWIAKQYLAAGFTHVVTGKKIPNFSEDIAVYGDTIFQVSFSSETKEFMDKVYKRNTGLTDLFREFLLFNLEKPKLEITVKITKNPALAQMIRKQIMGYFETKEGF